MTLIHRFLLKILLCEPAERAELLTYHIGSEADYERWKKRYARYVFVYGRHPQVS